MIRLELWQEAVGVLKNIKKEGDFTVLNLGSVGDLILRSDGVLISKLKKLMGERIGILRTDVPGKEYILRKLN